MRSARRLCSCRLLSPVGLVLLLSVPVVAVVEGVSHPLQLGLRVHPSLLHLVLAAERGVVVGVDLLAV